MKIICSFLALHFAISFCYSQVVTIDTLFVQGQVHHAEGMRLSSEGNRMKALQEFNIATDKLRDFQDGLQDKRDSVIKIFERLQSGDSQSPVYNYLLGRIIQMSKPDSAHSLLGARYLNKAVEIEPNYPWTYLALAYPYYTKGDFTTASSYYEKSLAVDSSFVFAYRQLRDCYLKLGRAEDAVHIVDLLNAKLPHSHDAIMLLLEKARTSGDVDNKIRIFREAIALSEDGNLTAMIYPELLYALYNKSSDSASALAGEVLKMPGQQYSKSRQTAYFILFRVAKQKGESAVDDFSDKILKTTDPYVLTTVGRYYLDSLMKNEKGARVLERAYQVCTKENAYNTLIVGLFTDQQLEEVGNNYRIWIAYDLGRAYFNLGKTDKAELYFTEAALGTAKEHVVDANFQLGSLFQKQHDKGNAIKWFSKGLALQNNDEAKKQLVILVGSENEATAMVEKLRKASAPMATSFKLLSIDGDSVELSSLRGKVVLIDFWATWCGPCLREMPHLQKIVEQYANNPDVRFLSISTDNSRETVKPFIEKNKYSMKVLYDDGAGLDYGVQSIPSLFLVDREGKIQFKHLGFSGDGVAFTKMIGSEIEELLQ